MYTTALDLCAERARYVPCNVMQGMPACGTKGLGGCHAADPRCTTNSELPGERREEQQPQHCRALNMRDLFLDVFASLSKSDK